jgi:hypothetical protein
MLSKTRAFRLVREERLADPEVAALYLEVTGEQSPEHLREAEEHVAAARQTHQEKMVSTSRSGRA